MANGLLSGDYGPAVDNDAAAYAAMLEEQARRQRAMQALKSGFQSLPGVQAAQTAMQTAPLISQAYWSMAMPQQQEKAPAAPSMTVYDPTPRDRLAIKMLGTEERPSPERRRFVEGLLGSSGLGSTGMGIVDFTPAGIPLAGSEAKRDINEGNYFGAAMNAMAMIPGVKPELAAARAAGKGIAGKAAALGEIATEAVDAAPKYARPGISRQLRQVHPEKAAQREIPGAPLGINTPQAEAARRQSYFNHVVEGAPGRLWYDDSGGSIMSHVGENVDQAKRLGGSMAVTSGGTTVAANSGFGVKGHMQANLDLPIVTGRFPTAMSARIDEIYKNGGVPPGQKIGAYDDQLAIGGGYYQKGSAGQGHRAVHDIWDGEAWGYVNPDGTPWREGFQPAQHAWMDRQMDRVLSRLNDDRAAGFNDWTPGRAQAAAWTGAKLRAGDIKPGEEAFSYKQAIPRSYAQGSRETVPGSNTGHGAAEAAGRPGLLNSPDEIRRAYDDEVAKIMYDAQGRDRIALGMGRYGGLSGSHFQGPGVYEGVNPGRQTQIPVGKEGAVSMRPGDPTVWRQNERVADGTIVPVRNPKTGVWEDKVAPKADAVDPASRTFMDAVEATYGLGTAQKASAWSKEFDGPVPLRNAAAFDFGRTITDTQAKAILKIPGLNMDKMAIVPTPEGMRVINLNYDPKDFDGVVAKIQQATGASKPRGVMSEGNYFENAWDKPEGRVGQQFLEKITKPDMSGAAEALKVGFDRTAPELFGKLKTLDDQFFREHGFMVSPLVQDMRAAVANEGHAGIANLVKRLGLGAAAIAPLTAAAASLGLLRDRSETAPDMPRGLL